MKLTLIRGLPGSGKSTMAKAMNCYHVEADMYFIENGEYLYNPAFIKAAHEWCQDKVREALSWNIDIVVSNTVSQRWEMNPYIKLADYFKAKIEIITCTGAWNSIHSVPDSVIEKMKQRWEK
jgi:predicted kinase